MRCISLSTLFFIILACALVGCGARQAPEYKLDLTKLASIEKDLVPLDSLESSVLDVEPRYMDSETSRIKSYWWTLNDPQNTKLILTEVSRYWYSRILVDREYFLHYPSLNNKKLEPILLGFCSDWESGFAHLTKSELLFYSYGKIESVQKYELCESFEATPYSCWEENTTLTFKRTGNKIHLMDSITVIDNIYVDPPYYE